MATTAASPSAAASASSTAFQAPPIPTTWRSSLNAWFRGVQRDTAAAELHLYSMSTPYFRSATLDNAPNAPLDVAHAAAAGKVSGGGHATDLDTDGHAGRATTGAELAADGKVGSIRLVDIGPERHKKPISGIGSWLGRKETPRLVNMLEIGTPQTRESEEKVILLHGYGAGTAFYFQNLEAISQHPNSRLYALDWLGMGRSARVPFDVPKSAQANTDTRVEAAESFFTDSLEDWREVMGLEKMTLVGHSLGGYLSIAYTLKYPERVNRLVLISPAGIGADPDRGEETFAPKNEAKQEHDTHSSRQREWSGNTELSNSEPDAVVAEVRTQQADVAPSTSTMAAEDARRVAEKAEAAGKKASEGTSAKDDGEYQHNPPPRLGKRRRQILTTLWDANFSPFGLLRNSFFFGPMLAGRYTSRRFGALSDEQLRTMHSYTAGIFMARGSSEYALAHLLAPGAYARKPMVDRIAPIKVPVSFMYGEHDWMDIQGGKEAVQRLKDAGNAHGSVFCVPHAGHHITLDNPRASNTLIRKILLGQADVAAKEGRRLRVGSGFSSDSETI
ncbi:Predicted hydrolase/acyltransferase (alpha/beta hydrolase superfamily) [Ceraceosorus bombacis]|uniref:Predicted hydrolase/acyltransferase (Alpha/beta hydrolase superfamily) n=1 Tax=Ceraceosorus bombacis TaxID=401625 RepID=A0A0P1BPI3_9BASI|nr:Predicted hydrolase/acyltransferase (alpha/beta hydrolase superfamily) [Ceraceosorus bombacis]